MKNKNLKETFNKNLIYIILSFLSRSFIPGFHVISSGIILLSIKYLSNENIKVFDKSRLLYAGGVNTIFFDKTGTLSEENLEIIGFSPICINQNSCELFLKYYTLNQLKDITSILINYYSTYQQDEQDFNNNITRDDKRINEIPKKMATLFLECMICCNNLEKINNKLVGNFLEKEILSQIKWQLKIISDDNDKKSNEQDNKKNSNNMTKNKSVQSNKTDNFSVYCKNGNNMKYKVKISEQKLDIYPNDYYKIGERKKVFNSKSIIFRDSSFTKELISQSNDLSDKKTGSIKNNQIIEDITRNINYNTYKLRICKRFIKVGTLYSSSIVYNPLIKTLYFMTKGPPEDIIPYCDYNFLPKDINKVITLYRKSGYINLILALKIINESNYDKSLGEDYYMSDLIFCGIIILKNKLKKDVKQVIQQLKNLNCDIILNTGDNIYNSVTVSYESGITSKKNIYVFDLNKITQKITLINFNEISKDEIIKYNINLNKNIDKSPNTKLKPKMTSTKLISHKMKFISKKLEKLNTLLVKEEGFSTPQLEDDNIKLHTSIPYHTSKIKKLNKTSEVPQLELNEIKNNYKIKGIKKNNRINKKDSNFQTSSINSNSELLLEKSSDRQIDSIDRKSNKININNNFYPVTNINTIDIPNNLPIVIKNKNKLRASTVLKSSTNQKIRRQNSKKFERKKTNNFLHEYTYEPKIDNEYYSSKLKSMRNDCVYCVSGRALKFIYENRFNPEYEKYEFVVLLNHIKKFGKIFYEMKSKDKSFLVDYFRALPNKITCMVGDGQNDIDAIMTSHVGININQPVNMNTVLCHFSPADGSLFCIEKIIRYGRVVYENIYLLGVSSFACLMILTLYVIIIYYEKIEIINTQVDFLSLSYFILLIFAFYIKPDVLVKTSPLFHNPSLFKIFFTIISILNLVIDFIHTLLFVIFFSKNKELEHDKERNVFGTYNFFFAYIQLFGMIFSINSITFYRMPLRNNYLFWLLIILIACGLSYIFCICGYSFHPLLYGVITFEFSSKNVDAFDDKNKLISFLIFASDLITCYLNVYIFFLIFTKKAKRELEKEEENIVKVKKN
jgi:magnesium-transporting ATPase (P-type)